MIYLLSCSPIRFQGISPSLSLGKWVIREKQMSDGWWQLWLTFSYMFRKSVVWWSHRFSQVSTFMLRRPCVFSWASLRNVPNRDELISCLTQGQTALISVQSWQHLNSNAPVSQRIKWPHECMSCWQWMTLVLWPWIERVQMKMYQKKKWYIYILMLQGSRAPHIPRHAFPLFFKRNDHISKVSVCCTVINLESYWFLKKVCCEKSSVKCCDGCHHAAGERHRSKWRERRATAGNTEEENKVKQSCVCHSIDG